MFQTKGEIIKSLERAPTLRQRIIKMAEKNVDIYYSKFNKSLGKIFNTRKKLCKAVSLCNLIDIKTDYEEEEECQHLLENTDEVTTLCNYINLITRAHLILLC